MLSFPHILFYPKIYYDKIVTLFEWILPPNYGARIWPWGSPPEFNVNYGTFQIGLNPGGEAHILNLLIRPRRNYLEDL